MIKSVSRRFPKGIYLRATSFRAMTATQSILSLLETLAVEDNTQEGFIDVDFVVVLDEAQSPGFVHEGIDPRSRVPMISTSVSWDTLIYQPLPSAIDISILLPATRHSSL